MLMKKTSGCFLKDLGLGVPEKGFTSENLPDGPTLNRKYLMYQMLLHFRNLPQKGCKCTWYDPHDKIYKCVLWFLFVLLRTASICVLQSTQMQSKCIHPNLKKYRSFLHSLSLGHKSGHFTFWKPSCVYKYLRTTRNSSLAHLQNLKYVWPNCRYAQITSYAHVGFWDKFNAASYRSTNISYVQIPV